MHVILSRGFAGSERLTYESCNSQSREQTVALVLNTKHKSPSGASIQELAALLVCHCRTRTPRRVVDLSAHHVEAVNRTIVDACRELIARRVNRVPGEIVTASAIRPSGA